MKLGLTPRQRDCFDVIKAYIGQHGQAPSYSEIAAGMGTKSKGRVGVLLAALEQRGWIKTDPHLSRSITVCAEHEGLPLYDLPAKVEAALKAYCDRTGEARRSVVADAVALFLDERESDGDPQ
jgi:SOS-response transcriptional repressor LexA